MDLNRGVSPPPTSAPEEVAAVWVDGTIMVVVVIEVVSMSVPLRTRRFGGGGRGDRSQLAVTPLGKQHQLLEQVSLTR